MSNNVKVDVDPDPNDTHQKILEAFFDYIQTYEKFIKNPGHTTRQRCRIKLLEIWHLSKQRRLELNQIHQEVRRLREEVYKENERQRQIKKANKGNDS